MEQTRVEKRDWLSCAFSPLVSLHLQWYASIQFHRWSSLYQVGYVLHNISVKCIVIMPYYIYHTQPICMHINHQNTSGIQDAIVVQTAAMTTNFTPNYDKSEFRMTSSHPLSNSTTMSDEQPNCIACRIFPSCCHLFQCNQRPPTFPPPPPRFEPEHFECNNVTSGWTFTCHHFLINHFLY